MLRLIIAPSSFHGMRENAANWKREQRNGKSPVAKNIKHCRRTLTSTADKERQPRISPPQTSSHQPPPIAARPTRAVAPCRCPRVASPTLELHRCPSPPPTPTSTPNAHPQSPPPMKIDRQDHHHHRHQHDRGFASPRVARPPRALAP